MLRRSLLQLSSRRSHGRIPIQITTQMPSYLASRRAFSLSQKTGPERPGSTDEVSESGSSFPKILLGGIALGAASVVAYRTGYLDKYLAKEPHSTIEFPKVPSGAEYQHDSQGSKSSQEGIEPIADSRFKDTSTSTSDSEHSVKDIVADSSSSLPEGISRTQEESPHQGNDKSELKPEHTEQIQEDQLPSSLKSFIQSDDTSDNVNKPSEENLGLKNPELDDHDQQKAIETTPSLYRESTAVSDHEKNSLPVSDAINPDSPRDDRGDGSDQSASLLGEYYLKNDSEVPAWDSTRKSEVLQGITEEPAQDSTRKSEDLQGINEGGYVSGDGKLIVDFLQAIHAAEERQAELDARAYTEEKRAMKAKYEKELRDARARELMYAEREAILEKELDKERVKAAAALKALEEELDEKHKMELHNMANEAELELKKVQELAKAELASAVASEKASQIEKMAEANLHINALCMAFYARSEEARQIHSVHKLALGAIALEDALSKGLPIQKEIEALRTYLEGTDKDSLLDLVLCSLPEETRINGTDTLLRLNQKFDTLKGTIRHFSLIPPGGGGILSHSLAHIASALKVSEADQSGHGIESLMNRVDNMLAQGKITEAADTLENGVQGTQAAEVVGDWVKRARNRAVTEQALTLLQSYATAVSLT